jgi:S-adenosylmethionine:tRNA-ribosyltransferase-isomerase (queuine synthetase)
MIVELFLHVFYAKKITGGKIEIFVERILTAHQVLAHLGSNKAIKAGQIFMLEDGSKVEVIERTGRLFILQFSADETILTRLKKLVISLCRLILSVKMNRKILRVIKLFMRSMKVR